MLETADDVADKVLRRAHVSKMTRALQDRLALAHDKIQLGRRGIDPLAATSFDKKRKRSDSNNDVFSDTSSSVSGQCFSAGLSASSPLSGPLFSDDIHTRSSTTKRTRAAGPAFVHPSQTQHRHRRRGSNAAQNTWKASHQLPQSSPIRHNRSSQRPSLAEYHRKSYGSTVTTSLESVSDSEDDDTDLPLHSFQRRYGEGPNITSSPPRTPSPSFSRSASLRGKAFSPVKDDRYAGRDGADLLIYLATSPSPALNKNKSTTMQPPSTPPSKQTPLPSSVMSPANGHAFFGGFGSTTPNNAGFNFADFVNVTPSPRWPRTPVMRTPLAGRSSRQMPPPSITSPSFHNNRTGLGMELGGSLH